MSKNAFKSFENYARSLLKAPESLLHLCMNQYSAREKEKERRIKAENLAEQRKRSNETIAVMIRAERDKFKEADRELGRYKKRYEEKVKSTELLKRRFDAVVEMANRASEVIAGLKEQVASLKKRADEAETERDMARKEQERALTEAEMSQREASRLQEQVGLHGRARFDSKTEKTANMFHGIDVEEDPLDEEAPVDGYHNNSAEETIRWVGEVIENAPGDPGDADGDDSIVVPTRKKAEKPKKRVGKREEDLEGAHLRRETCCYTQDELDRMFEGEAGYRVYGGNRRIRFGRVRPAVYATEEYTPKVVVHDEKGRRKYVKTLPYKNTFFKRSKCDPSLIVSCVYDKFNLGLPFNRLEKELASYGIRISRQDMTYWADHFSDTAFMPVCRRLMEHMWEDSQVVHIDETTWRVVDWKNMSRKEQRKYIKKNGSKGFIWVMSTGELTQGNQVVIYTYAPSRSTAVLERLIEQGLDRVVYIVCDAYSAYSCFVKQFPDKFVRCLCWMHTRRKWAEAVVVLKPWMSKKLSRSQILAIPEIKGLLLANAVFVADKPLKAYGSALRHKMRRGEVKPHVDRFFEFIRSIDIDDEGVSEKLKEAVTYSLNHEEPLRAFLTNGNIPMDNGKAERLVKPLATTRKNSLFSFSQKGAENAAMIHSVIETAKANKADVYCYLKYLITMMPDRPRRAVGKRNKKEFISDDEYYAMFTKEFLDDMMPWSKKYREYERWHIENHIDEIMPESDALPEGIKGRAKKVA